MCKKEWVWGQRNIHFYAFVWGVCLVFILPFPLNNFDCMGKKKSTKPSHILCFNKSYFNCVSSNGFWRWECTQVPDRAVTLRGDADPIPRYSICLAPLLLQWMEIEVWAIFVLLVGLWAIQNAALPLMMATALPLTVRPGSRWVPSLKVPTQFLVENPRCFSQWERMRCQTREDVLPAGHPILGTRSPVWDSRILENWVDAATYRCMEKLETYSELPIPEMSQSLRGTNRIISWVHSVANTRLKTPAVCKAESNTGWHRFGDCVTESSRLGDLFKQNVPLNIHLHTKARL